MGTGAKQSRSHWEGDRQSTTRFKTTTGTSVNIGGVGKIERVLPCIFVYLIGRYSLGCLVLTTIMTELAAAGVENLLQDGRHFIIIIITITIIIIITHSISAWLSL